MARLLRKFHTSIALLLSAIVFLLALLLIRLSETSELLKNETLLIREINIAIPPPPAPPPPMEMVEAVEQSIALNIEGSGPAVLNIKQQQKHTLTIAKPSIPDVKASVPELSEFNVNWDAFSLADLDGLPQLLTPLKAKFPKSLVRAGVDKAKVKLDIVIDEQGQVSLVNILENPYPELKAEINRIIRASRFSIPKKGDVAVRARFIWPLEFKS